MEGDYRVSHPRGLTTLTEEVGAEEAEGTGGGVGGGMDVKRVKEGKEEAAGQGKMKKRSIWKRILFLN